MTVGKWWTALLGTFLVLGAVSLTISFVAGGGSTGAVASLDELEDREVIYLEEHHAFLVYNDGTPLALSDDPQHMDGEHTEWCESSRMFETPTHGEKFDRRGNYYGGPAQKGLDRFPVTVEGSSIFVDFDQLIAGPERGASEQLDPEGPFCVPT